MKMSNRTFRFVTAFTLAIALAAMLAVFAWRQERQKEPQSWELPLVGWNYTASVSPRDDTAVVSFMRNGSISSPPSPWVITKIRQAFGINSTVMSGPAPPSPGGWSGDYAVDVRDSNGKLLRGLQAPSPNVSWLTRPVFSPDGTLIATIYSDNELMKIDKSDPVANAVAGKHVAVWKVADGKIVWKSRYADAKENAGGYTVQWTPDGKYLVVDGDYLRVMDAQTGKRLRTLAQAYYMSTGAVLSPDGKRVVTVNEGKRVPKGSYNGPGLAIIRDLTGRVLVRMPGQGTYFTWQTSQVYWTRDGKLLIQGLGNQVRAWSSDGKSLLWTMPLKNARSVVTSYSDKMAWVSSIMLPGCTSEPHDCTSVSTVQVVDLRTRKPLWQKQVKGYVDYVRFVTKGKRLLSVVGANPNASVKPPTSYQLWNAASGKNLQNATLKGDWASALFYADNKRVLLQSADQLAVWQLEGLQ